MSRVIIYTLIIEAVTLYARFVLKYDAPQGGIHHGYVGIAMIATGTYPEIGKALVLSDIIHHTILKITTGNSEFP